MNAIEERILAKMGAEMKTSQERMEARRDATNEMFEVLRGTLVSRMDIHLARTQAIEKEIIANMYAHQERMGACVNA
jgi:hypothetical protein